MNGIFFIPFASPFQESVIMEKKVKWGILGPGKIAHKFAEALKSLDNVELYAVASRSQEAARIFAEKHQVLRAYGSYEELVQDPEAELIYVATPHGLHKEHTLLCLNHKKPVLCEKPMAHKYTDARQMVEASVFNQVFLMEAMWSRFLPPVNKALEWIREGKIGTVKKVKADFGFSTHVDPHSRLYNMALGGGSLLDVGVYPVFLALTVLGEPSGYEVSAQLAATGADQDCKVLLHYPGALAELHSSIVTDTPREAVIEGTEGTIRFMAPWYRETTLLLTNAQGEEVFAPPATGNGFEAQIKEAVSCVRKGSIESEVMPHRFSLLQSKVLDLLCKAGGIIYP